jgi:hypothetical protein
MKEQISPMKTNHSTSAHFLQRHQFLFFLLMLWALSAAHAYAQSATATLSGTVTDERSAVVVGATVSAVNFATSLTRKAKTNSDGYFTLPLLPPGNYTLRIEGQGFAILERRDVILNVGDQRSVLVQLRVGNVAATINVRDGASLLNESPAVGTVVDRQFLENLPLNGRSFQSLLALTPGVVFTNTGFYVKGQFSVNGQRSNSNYFTVDGVSANTGIGNNLGNIGAEGSFPSFTAFGGTNSLASVDAVEEFRVQTSTFAAEFGRTPGAQVSIVTRSGTNDFRGTLFEYFRHDALDANNWIANSRSLPKAALRQNQFGGVIGGPVIKDKTFFFGSYEGLRLRQPRSRITEVPTLALRREAPAFTRALLDAYPLPNGKATRPGFAEFVGTWSDPSKLDAYSVRVDHNVSNGLTLFGRYNDAPSSGEERGPFTSALHRRLVSEFRSQSLTFGGSLVITPRIVNEARFNWTSSKAGSSEVLDNFGGATPPSLSVFGLPASVKNPGVYIAAGSNQYFFAPGNADNRQRQMNLVNNLSLTAGTHQVKLGIDYRRISPSYRFLDYELYLYLGDEASIRSGMADYEIYSHQEGTASPLFHNFSVFAQDTWRARPRLTVTYGLRWELNPPPTGGNLDAAYTINSLDNPATMTLAPKGTPLWKTTYNNFAPRFGLAYQVRDSARYSTVLRGGAGIFYDMGTDQSGTGFGGPGYFFPYTSYTGGSGSLPLTAAALTPPALSLAPPYGLLNVADPKLKLPYTIQWNVTVDQLIGARQTLSASYVAAVGRRLLRQDLLTDLNPNFTALFATRNTATSNYHGLQLQHQLRLARGLQALTSYTWSHSIDTASDSAGGPTGSEGIPLTNGDASRDRGPSDFDIRHTFASALTYDFPKTKVNSVIDPLLRGWGADAIITARSATPVNVLSYRAGYTMRPDLVPNVPRYVDDSAVPGGRRINQAAFIIPSTPRQGTLGRNALRGFGATQLNVALRRQFSLTERLNLQFRVEAFNALNHPNFNNPQGRLDRGLFGQATDILANSYGSSSLNAVYQVGGPRSIQFGLKLQF